MKSKFLAVAAVIAAVLSFVPDLYAIGGSDSRVGVTVGINVSGMGFKDIKSENVVGYNMGLTAYCPVGLGFAIQPSVLYLTKGLSYDAGKQTDHLLSNIKAMNMSVSYIEIPVQLQWGPDLLFFRPYAFVEPFVGYGMNVRSKVDGNKFNSTNFTLPDASKINRWEYGTALGLGLQVGPVQVAAKYYWNFGGLADSSSPSAGKLFDSAVEKDSFKGVMIQAAILF